MKKMAYRGNDGIKETYVLPFLAFVLAHVVVVVVVVVALPFVLSSLVLRLPCTGFEILTNAFYTIPVNLPT
jgi:hypothetical protein